jgi:hypothetical protein
VIASLHELTLLPYLVHDTTRFSHLLCRGHPISVSLCNLDSLLVAVVRDEKQDTPSEGTRKQPPLAFATTRLVMRQVIRIGRRQPVLFGHLPNSDHPAVEKVSGRYSIFCGPVQVSHSASVTVFSPLVSSVVQLVA